MASAWWSPAPAASRGICAITGSASKSASPWELPRDRFARSAHLARRSPGASGKGRQPPYRSETEATRGQACGRLHLQGRLRCVGRASPQGNQEGRNSTLSQILRIFNKDVLPSLKQMSIYDIRRPQLLGVLARIEERKAFTTAEKVRTWLGQLFRYALVIGRGWKPIRPPTWTWWPSPSPGEPQPLPASSGASRVPAQAQALQPSWLADPTRHPAVVPDRRAYRRAAAGDPGPVRSRPWLWIIPPQIVKQPKTRCARPASARRTFRPHRAVVRAGHRDRALPV